MPLLSHRLGTLDVERPSFPEQAESKWQRPRLCPFHFPHSFPQLFQGLPQPEQQVAAPFRW